MMGACQWPGGKRKDIKLQSAFTEYKIRNNQYGGFHFIFILIGLTSTVISLAQSRKKGQKTNTEITLL